jgi:hypothetical protein
MVECRETEDKILERSINDGRMFKHWRDICGPKPKNVECWKSARKILEGSINDGRMFESWLGIRAQQKWWTEIEEKMLESSINAVLCQKIEEQTYERSIDDGWKFKGNRS